MEQKKGQASMEFLMTYGWAILAAVLAISVLAYYGVFSPGNSLPNICLINNPFGCDEYSVNTSDVRVILRNGAGSAIAISNFSVSGCGEISGVGAINMTDGSTSDILISCTPGAAGSKFNGKINIAYLASGKTITQYSTGDIRAGVA